MGKGPAASKGNTTDVTKDRYPSARAAFSRILEQGGLPDGPVERVEMTALANGEVTYRYWTVNAEEPEGGVLSATS